MQTAWTFLSLITFFTGQAAIAQVDLTPAQRADLSPCLTETDNLRRLLCFDLALGVSLETAWSEPDPAPRLSTTSVELRDLAFPHLSPVLNALEAARSKGARGWQFALYAPRLNDETLPGILYGPGDLFTDASSLYWPTPEAVLQTGVQIFASQRARDLRGRETVAAYLVATCADEFPALTLALNMPVSQESYLVQEAYPDGRISQSIWRALNGGLVLEMARGLPALEAMEAMRPVGLLTLSYQEAGEEVFLTFETTDFADVAASIAYSCNSLLVQEQPPELPKRLPPPRPADSSNI